jgi:hypothetical protein
VQAAGVILTASLALAGCSSPEVTPTSSPAASEDAWDSSYVEPEATVLAPLRGTTVPAGSADNPSLAVKIDNHEAARPQFGLETTDIVFEELVEGGLTRYVAVWQSQVPDEVGPVRSVRPMDPDIISPLGGIVAYSGGQQIFVDMMMAAPVVNAVFDYDSTGLFRRMSAYEAPHNVMVKSAELVQRNADLAAPAQQFAYAPSIAQSSAVIDGTAISSLNLRFSNARYPSWSWNAESGTYLRSQEGSADLDTAGAQRSTTNLIVMKVGIDRGSYPNLPKTLTIGTGEAWISVGGKTVSATWSKDSQTSPMRFVDANGVTVRLAPGNTWVELVPSDQGSVELLP